MGKLTGLVKSARRIPRRPLVALLAAAMLLLMASACPGRGARISISISPDSAKLLVGESQEFTATVSGTENTAVSWEASGGTIDGSGNTVTYTAPEQPGTFTLTATSLADPGKSATAEITVKEPPAFVSTWGTSLGAGTTVTLALAGTVDATIDWGDGTIQNVDDEGAHVHDYGEDGVYTVSVTGTVTAYNSRFNIGGAVSEREKLISVDAWGDVGFTSMADAFHSASNLTSVPATSEELENVTDMSFMFADASSFNRDIGGGDTGNVTDMSRMFQDASSFNQDLSGWCVELITSKPTNFDTGADSWDLPQPVWGECP